MSIIQEKINVETAVPADIYVQALTESLNCMNKASLDMANPELVYPLAQDLVQEIRKVKRGEYAGNIKYWEYLKSLDAKIYDIISYVQVIENSPLERADVQCAILSANAKAFSHIMIGEIMEDLVEDEPDLSPRMH